VSLTAIAIAAVTTVAVPRHASTCLASVYLPSGDLELNIVLNACSNCIIL
jgi:hypothetical protein